jgi:hypothetical protein
MALEVAVRPRAAAARDECRRVVEADSLAPLAVQRGGVAGRVDGAEHVATAEQFMAPKRELVGMIRELIEAREVEGDFRDDVSPTRLHSCRGGCEFVAGKCSRSAVSPGRVGGLRPS